MELEEVLSVWWVYPVSVAVATLALSSGISGALFFAPFFLLVVGLTPAQAIGGGLMTELLGTFFGTMNYVRQGVVDFTIVKALLIVTIPFAMAGSGLALMIDAGALQAVFGVALIILAVFMLWTNLRRVETVVGEATTSTTGHITVMNARDGREYRYVRPSRGISQCLGSFGAFITGLMSSGLPEINTTQLVLRGRIPPRIAVGTSITILTVTVFFAAGIHAIAGEPAWYVVVWSIPGVITGAQIGPRIQGKIPANIAERMLAMVFVAVGILVIAVQIFD
jgi:uncharacterized membrane protein YfcA